MKRYIVKWLEEEHTLEDVKEAILYAEKIAEENWCDSFVFVESLEGVREDEPFFRCELII